MGRVWGDLGRFLPRSLGRLCLPRREIGVSGGKMHGHKNKEKGTEKEDKAGTGEHRSGDGAPAGDAKAEGKKGQVAQKIGRQAREGREGRTYRRHKASEAEVEASKVIAREKYRQQIKDLEALIKTI